MSNNKKSQNQGLYHTTTIGAQKEKIEKLMNDLVRFMDKLDYDVEIKFNKRNNEPEAEAESVASEILMKHEDENEYHFHESDRKFIIEAMKEFAMYVSKKEKRK